jgi:nucleoside-diphosphate-sugar epimerase
VTRSVVVGKGPVGSTLAQRLVERGDEVLVLSRSGGGSNEVAAHPAVEHRAVDAADAGALAAAAGGADVLYNCVNPAYHRWATDWPPVATALLDAAEQTGAVLVTMSNLYGYGPVDGPMTEATPLAATGTKGRVRVAMWQQALARHEAGRVQVVEARASDFVGPRVTDGGFLAQRVVPAVLRGKGVQCLGDPDVPHSWTALADVATTLVALGTQERAWGRAWHVPTAPPVSFREAVAGLCAAAGVPPVRVARIPDLAVRAVGLLSPTIRELEETRHQRVRPFVLDSSAATAELGLTATPLEQTWADTVAWWQERQGTPIAA